MVKISPSILSADFSKLCEELRLCEMGGADIIHLDVMDGHFVPNITFGPVVIKSIRKCVKTPFDAHLMIENPEKYIKDFVDAGADIITPHIEVKCPIDSLIKKIKNYGVEVGLALNPDTPFKKAVPYIDKIDYLLVMSVYPGFAGQKFIKEILGKIKEAKEYIIKENLTTKIAVDGGVKHSNAKEIIDAGADILVAASAIFSGDIIENIKKFKKF